MCTAIELQKLVSWRSCLRGLTRRTSWLMMVLFMVRLSLRATDERFKSLRLDIIRNSLHEVTQLIFLLEQTSFLFHLVLDVVSLILKLNQVNVSLRAELFRPQLDYVHLPLLLSYLRSHPIECLHRDLLLLLVTLKLLRLIRHIGLHVISLAPHVFGLILDLIIDLFPFIQPRFVHTLTSPLPQLSFQLFISRAASIGQRLDKVYKLLCVRTFQS